MLMCSVTYFTLFWGVVFRRTTPLVIVSVADDAGHLSHGGQLLAHILYIYDLTAFDVELVEHFVPVDEINPVPFAECEFRERRQGYLLCFAEPDVPLPVGGNFHRHTENTLA